MEFNEEEFETLLDLGLSKNEAKTYLGLVNKGTLTATELAKEIKVHRPNVYDSLRKLIRRGLVAKNKKEGKTLFSASNPRQLMHILRNKERELENIIPRLEAKKEGEEKAPTEVEIYEGVAGIRKGLLDLIEEESNLHVMGVPKDAVVVMGEGWLKGWHEQRINNDVEFHHLLNEDYYERRIKVLEELPKTDYKYLPKEYKIPIAPTITENSVLLLIFEPNPLAIHIKSEEVASGFLQYFWALWEFAKEKD